MRVLLLVASSRGGGATYLVDLAHGLAGRGFRVEVAMPADGGTIGPANFTPAGIPFHEVAIHEGFSAGAVRQVRELLAGVDLVHMIGARAALFGRLAALTRATMRPRLVYAIQGFALPFYPQPRRGILLGIERALAPLVDRYLAVSHAEKAALVGAGVAAAGRVEVVWNGIDLARFSAAGHDRAAERARLGVPAERCLLTMVCRLYKPRDFATLLTAVAQTRQQAPHLHLLIVGDGPQRSEVEAQIAALDLGGAVTLAGWQTRLPEIYAASDIYTLTTWGWEGLPISVLEAMAGGLPVVATRAGGIPEIVRPANGFLVNRRDATGLAAALVELACDPGLRARMGAAGRRIAQTEFSVAQMVAATAGVFARVLE